MNYIAGLIPKADVAYLDGTDTIRQAVEKMTFTHYQAMPVLGSQGHYLYSVSANDILCYLHDRTLSLHDMELIPLSDVPIYRPIMALSIAATPKEVEDALMSQNYVSMVDDKGIFIGIITRRSYIEAVRKK